VAFSNQWKLAQLSCLTPTIEFALFIFPNIPHGSIKLSAGSVYSCDACSNEAILPQHLTSSRKFWTLLPTTTARWLNHFCGSLKATQSLSSLVGYFCRTALAVVSFRQQLMVEEPEWGRAIRDGGGGDA